MAAHLRRLTLVTLALLGLLAVAGMATPRAATSDYHGPPQQANGHGKWFESVCDHSNPNFAGCSSYVVSDQSGTPLAGATPPSGALTPALIHSAYNLPASAPGAQMIGIVDAYNDPNIEADLATYSSQYGLPACTTQNGCFWKVDQNGGSNYPTTDSGWSLEIALDVEVAHATCPNCVILLVEAASASFSNLLAAENRAVSLGATVVSNSWGGSEFSSETLYDSYFNHPGVPITVSSGDSGYGVEYPAASHNVTAVGGTTLSWNGDGSYGSEKAWSSAGSGCSRYESKPAWQTDSGCSRRTVADVSADADPNSGAAVYDSVTYNGQAGWFQVGGTSLSSPLVASVFALTGTAAQATPQTPYTNAAQLHDVVGGANGNCSPAYLCAAVSGFDGPTGLGSPNGPGAFTAGPPPPPPSPDFSLASQPTSRTVTQGQQTTYTVSLTGLNGFADSVDLSASGLPADASASFSPAAISPSSSASTLTVTTAATTPTGSFTVTVTGTDAANAALTHQIPVTLVVQAPAPPPPADFSLSLSPQSQTVRAPATVTYTVTVNPLNGFTSPVTLSLSGLTASFTYSFSTNPATSTSTLTIHAPNVSGHKTYSFTVHGTAGSLSHTVSGSLSLR